MEKRLILAIVASAIVLMAWSSFMPKPQQEAVPPSNPLTESISVPKTTILASPSAVKENIALPEKLVTLETQKLKIVFNENQGAIKEVFFKDYQSYKLMLHNGLDINSILNFRKEKVEENNIVFRSTDKEKEVVKKFSFSNSNYGAELEISVKNLTSSSLSFDYPLILGILDLSDPKAPPQNFDFSIYSSEKLTRPNIHKDQNFKEVNFLSLRDRYFCAILAAEKNEAPGFIKKLEAKKSEIGLLNSLTNIASGGKAVQKFRIYLGPQDLKLIAPVNANWSAVVHYGTFDIIAQLLLKLLEIFYNIVHNWGFAIVLLSLAVYLLLYPLTLKQMRSMKEMQILQPKIQELQKLYKDNPQKLNKEIMALYKEHKVNPLGGCLPLLLQMPIFFALYQALMRTVALKGAKFLWVKDLSEPDKLFVLPNSLPILGNEINLLPILMMVGMFIQQKITMASGGQNNEQQKIMLIVFPLIFGIIFYHMPAGLVLYWFVNSILMLVTQIKTSIAK